MNRIERVREVIDERLLSISDLYVRRTAYVHLYGVSQTCAILATKRKENVELATIAGMLHDIYTYATLDSLEHAHKGAVMAKELLEQLNFFSNEEIDMIYSAIYNHSDKSNVHSAFDEILKDADVLQHVFYNPLLAISEHEKIRYDNLIDELNLVA